MNFIAFLPMCFCCSDTGWCKLPCPQLCCWSTALCSSLLSHAGRISKTSIMAEGSNLTWCSVSSAVRKVSLSRQHTSSHQSPLLFTSDCFLLDRNQQHQAWSPSDSCPAPHRYLILYTRFTFAADGNLKSHSTGIWQHRAKVHTPLTQQIYVYKFILKLKCPKYKHPHHQ